MRWQNLLPNWAGWWLDYNEQFGQYVQKTSTIVDATSEFKIYQLNPVSK